MKIKTVWNHHPVNTLVPRHAKLHGQDAHTHDTRENAHGAIPSAQRFCTSLIASDSLSFPFFVRLVLATEYTEEGEKKSTDWIWLVSHTLTGVCLWSTWLWEDMGGKNCCGGLQSTRSCNNIRLIYCHPWSWDHQVRTASAALCPYPTPSDLSVSGKQVQELCPSLSWPPRPQRCIRWRPQIMWAKPSGNQDGNSWICNSPACLVMFSLDLREVWPG